MMTMQRLGNRALGLMPYWKRSVLFSGPCAVLFFPGPVLLFSTAHVVQNESPWLPTSVRSCLAGSEDFPMGRVSCIA